MYGHIVALFVRNVIHHLWHF